MDWSNAVVTNEGLVLLRKVMDGGVLRLTTAAGGTGTVPVEVLMMQTGLKSQKQSFAITSSTNVEAGKKVCVQIDNTGLSVGYTMNQLGIWASVDGGPPAMLAILQDETGMVIPSMTEIREFKLNFYAVINFSNAASFQILLDPDAYVSYGALDELLKLKADLVGGTVPMEQLPVRVIRVRDRDPGKPDYGLGGGAAVTLRAGPYTGTAEITLQVEESEYDAENMSAKPQEAPSGTIIIRKVEE